MDTDIHNDEIFDDYFLNWSESNPFEMSSPPPSNTSSISSSTDTDSDSGIGTTNTNSPSSSNEQSNDFILDFNSNKTADSSTELTNNPFDSYFDINSFSTDDLLNNLDLLFKDDELIQNKDNQQQHNQLQQQQQQEEEDVTIIDNDIQIIEEIKNEPFEQQQQQKKLLNKIIKNESKQLINTKDETIANLINQLKSCNNSQQQQQTQNGKKETIKIINDQQLIQLLNTRQIQLSTTNRPQVTTIKQIKTLQGQPKVQISSSINNQQIVSVLPAATIIKGSHHQPVQQQPPIVITNNPSLNTKFLSIQPVNKVIAIAPQTTTIDIDTVGGRGGAKRIKIEDGTSVASTPRNNIKPLAPKIKSSDSPPPPPPPLAVKQNQTTNMNRSSSIEMILQPAAINQVPSISTILYSTESQQQHQTALCFGSNDDASSDVNSNNGGESMYLSSLSKKQFRMMKNRESACLSRKRKKEYVQNLEDKLKEIFIENQKLKSENNSLKEKISSLTIENNALKTKNPNAMVQTRTNKNSLKRPFVMFAILFVMGLNVFQFINLNGSRQSFPINENGISFMELNKQQEFNLLGSSSLDSKEIQNPADSSALSVLHVGRTLLSDYDYDQTDSKEKSGDNNKLKDLKSDLSKIQTNELIDIKKKDRQNNNSLELVNINNTWHYIDPNICANISSFFNRTHSIKVNSELYDWYERHNKANKLNIMKKIQPTTVSDKIINSNEQKQAPKIFKMNTNNENNKRNKLKLEKKSNYELSLYNQDEKIYEEFVRTIRRRNDTFYVLSFRRDHLMFPALNHNKTQKPRMSILMPALVQINDTNMRNAHNTIAFMQIDCEVLDTSLIYLKSSNIPLNYVKILLEDYDLLSTTKATTTDPNAK